MAHSISSKFELTPVLLTPEDIMGLESDQDYDYSYFYVTSIKKVLEAKRKDGHDGIAQAAAKLLTEPAVAILHVDTTKRRKPFRSNRYAHEADKNTPIAFNDHFGGSESRFKVLLNGSPNDPDNSYVLYSPPLEDGSPSYARFHKADFTFLSDEPRGLYTGYGGVPNPLKTGGVSQYRGRSGYKHYLFGGPDVRHQLYQAFSTAGFEFVDSPYPTTFGRRQDDKLDLPMTHEEIGRLEGPASNTLGYRGMHFWPGDQFAENLKLLGLEVPKFRVEDYPLVRPENTLGS